MKHILQKATRSTLVLAASAFAFSAHLAHAQTELPKDVETGEAFCIISDDFAKLIKSRKTDKSPNNLSFNDGEESMPVL